MDPPALGTDGYLYEIGTADFQNFLQNPSYAWLQGGKKHQFYEASDVFFLGGYSRMPVFFNLKLMAGDSFGWLGDFFLNFLKAYGFDETVLSTTVFTSTYVPITIWVKTEKRNLFITVKWNGEDTYNTGPHGEYIEEPYIFSLYTEEGYVNTFSLCEGTLVVDGVEVTTYLPVNLCQHYAILPLTDVLLACGATLVSETDTKRTFLFENKKYVLDLEREALLYENGSEVGARAGVLIGPVGIYRSVQNGDLMVGDNVLWMLLSEMTGKNVNVQCDISSGQVKLTTDCEGDTVVYPYFIPKWDTPTGMGDSTTA